MRNRRPHYTCHYTCVTYLDNVWSHMILKSPLMTSWFSPRDRARGATHATARDDRSRTHARVTRLPPRRSIQREEKDVPSPPANTLAGTILSAIIVCTSHHVTTEERYVRANEPRSRSTASTNWQREWKKGVTQSKLRKQLYDIHKNDVMEYFVSPVSFAGIEVI